MQLDLKNWTTSTRDFRVLTLHDPESNEIVCYWAYGCFKPAFFAQVISRKTGYRFALEEVRHSHICEVEGEDGTFHLSCPENEPGHAVITEVEV